jgi:DNA-binding GntR family transcriptional regulator
MPVPRVRSVERIHERLRSLIMTGAYEPGAILSQVELARMLGVSRTPLREAMRRLEAEGLIEAEQNQRARVASIGAEALDVKFTDWILLQAMGIKVTVPLLTELDLNGILASTTSFRLATERGDAHTWDRARKSLHGAYIARAGYRLRAAIEDQFDACERYRRMYVPLSAEVATAYIAIAGSCIARDAEDVTRRIARLDVSLARATLTAVDPGYAPSAVITALRMIAGDAAN